MSDTITVVTSAINETVTVVTSAINEFVTINTSTENVSIIINEAGTPTLWGNIIGNINLQTDLYAALSALQSLSYTDFVILSAGQDVTNTFLTSNSALWVDSYTWVVNNSAAALYTPPTSALKTGDYELSLGVDGTINLPASIDGNALIQTTANAIELNADGTVTSFNNDGSITQNGLTVLYDNVYANVGFETIQQFAASNPANIVKGYTVTLINNRVYIFAGTDPTNYSHYLELNANPFTPIYQEIALNQNQTLIDMYYLGDFKTAKYTLQVETTFNNEIYYSELNVVGSVQTQTGAVSEYGQISTSELVLGYSVDINANYLYLYLNHSIDTDSSHKLLVKGLRTNHYKI